MQVETEFDIAHAVSSLLGMLSGFSVNRRLLGRLEDR